jgi:hypothetical protein
MTACAVTSTFLKFTESMAQSDFQPALPVPVKWSTGDNRYDSAGKQPRSLSLFVPLDSAYALAQHIINTADDSARHKTGKVWNYETKAEVEVQGFYINGKGRQGSDGDFGTINPAAAQPVAGEALPF